MITLAITKKRLPAADLSGPKTYPPWRATFAWFARHMTARPRVPDSPAPQPAGLIARRVRQRPHIWPGRRRTASEGLRLGRGGGLGTRRWQWAASRSAWLSQRVTLRARSPPSRILTYVIGPSPDLSRSCTAVMIVTPFLSFKTSMGLAA